MLNKVLAKIHVNKVKKFTKKTAYVDYAIKLENILQEDITSIRDRIERFGYIQAIRY